MWSEYKYCDFSYFRRVDVLYGLRFDLSWGMFHPLNTGALCVAGWTIPREAVGGGMVWVSYIRAGVLSGGPVGCREDTVKSSTVLADWMSLLSSIGFSLVYFEALIVGLLSRMLT